MKKSNKAICLDDLEISVLPKVDASLFAPLLELLKTKKIPFRPTGASGRRGFPKHRACVFGMTKSRYSGKIGVSAPSKKWSAIYEELKRVGNIICPFAFTSIHLNNNVVCPIHKDESNVGKSILISFGDYTGGNIVIEEKMYDAYLQPILFNGSLLNHWNTDDLVGNKYSLVFYISPYTSVEH